MKTIKQFSIFFFAILCSLSLYSQEYKKVKADTIRLKTENYLLEVSTFDLKKNTLKDADIKAKISELQGVLENLEIESPKDGERVCVSYTGYIKGEELDYKQLILKSSEAKTKKLIVKDENLLQTDLGKFVLEVEDKTYCIRLYTNGLDEINLDSDEFANLIQKADQAIPENRKKTNGWLIENADKNLNSYFVNETPPFTLDMLELSAGISTGIVKNQFVTGFNVRAGVEFAKKGIMKNKFFADYEILYDFSNPPTDKPFALNNFLSLGYARNFSLDPNKAKWYGFSVGYLVKRNNDFFEKNTVRLSVHKQISNSITIKPEVYIGKNVMPGLKFQFTF